MAIEGDLNLCKRTILFGIFTVLVVLGAKSRSYAQDQPFKRFDLYGGYSFLRLDSKSFGFNNDSNMNGWNAGLAFNFNETWALAADASGNYGSQLTAYNFLIGPQYSYRRRRSRIFGQIMGGKAQNTVNISTAVRNGFESVGRAIALGGGFDYDLTNRFTFRVIQADYLNTSTFTHTQNDVRVSTGLVFHFGVKKKLF
jgi:hypothetical protein